MIACRKKPKKLFSINGLLFISSVAVEQELEKVKLELANSYSRMLVMEEEFTSARKSVENENFRLLNELEELQERHERHETKFICLLYITFDVIVVNLSLHCSHWPIS